MQTIFYDLPRLSNISCDEWATLKYIKQKITYKPPNIKWGDESSQISFSLAECSVPIWIMKTEGMNFRK